MSSLNEVVVWGSFEAPLNTVVAGATLVATDANGIQVVVSLAVGQTSAQLTLDVGVWTLSVQATSDTGSPVGAAVVDSQVYTVEAAATTVTVQVPVQLSGTLV